MGSPKGVPQTVEFRFKTQPASIDTPASQSLWSLGGGRFVKLVLEYDTSLLASGSYSGSTPNPNYKSGSLKFTTDNFATSTALSLPFLDSGWWSVSVNRDSANNFTLRAANSIYSGSNGSSLGWEASSSFETSDESYWTSVTSSNFPSLDRSNIQPEYTPISGSYQEIRYHANPSGAPFNTQSFFDYTMNPQSIEGNTISSTPKELAFRASLGGELYTGSNSIHPKVTGSWVPIPSFISNSNFNFNGGGTFSPNRDYIFMDQPAVGIKNRISDKIRSVGLQLPEGPQQLSNIKSIQQVNNTESGSYTDSTDLLEVSFSPTNQINDDIINSLGYFNIGDYIGDPREISSDSTSYPDLNVLRDNNIIINLVSWRKRYL